MNGRFFDLEAALKKLPSSSELPDQFHYDESPHIGDYASETWEEAERLQYVIELLRDAHEGRVLPEAVDNALVGPDPVRVKPTVYPLDCYELARWSPEMAAAWILFRTEEAVSRHFGEAFVGSSVWVPSTKEYSPSTNTCRTKGIGRSPAKDWRSGYDCVELEGTNLLSEFYDFYGRKQCLSPVRYWFDALRPLLVENKIRALGRRSGENTRIKKIASTYWVEGTFSFSEAHGTILNIGNKEFFSKLSFSARAIIKNFPPEPQAVKPTLRFRPWAKGPQADCDYRLPWHRQLHNLLREQSPHGFPVIPGTTKTRDAFLLNFLKKVKIKPEARDALVNDIGFNDQRSSQNIDRFIKRRCGDTSEILPMEFGPAMAAAVGDALQMDV